MELSLDIPGRFCTVDGLYSITPRITSPLPIDSPRGVRPPAPLREFVAGPENRLLSAAVDDFLSKSDAVFSPLVLYGPCGSGKSHLARTLALGRLSARHGASAVFFAAADFAREHRLAVETRGRTAFRARFGNTDLLAVEHIEELATRPAAQQELSGIIDLVAEHGGRVLITMRRSLGAAPRLSSRLRSRLATGLCLHLHHPGNATRRVIAERLTNARGATIDAAAADALAVRLPVGVPPLVAAVDELIRDCPTRPARITEDATRRLLARRTGKIVPTLPTIASGTARVLRVKLSALRSSSRRQSLVHARGVAMYIARQLTDQSLAAIGNYFGGRDHTTVLHACRRTETLLASDPTTREAVQEVYRWLQDP